MIIQTARAKEHCKQTPAPPTPEHDKFVRTARAKEHCNETPPPATPEHDRVVQTARAKEHWKVMKSIGKFPMLFHLRF